MINFFLNHLLFGFTMFAAAAPPLTGAPSGESGAGSGSAPQSGGESAPANGSGTQPGQPAAGQQPQQGVDGLKQLRDTYENLKKEFEPWQKLNVKPDQVSQFQGVYQKVYNEAAAIGRELGYPDDEIAEALAEDPIRTIEFLRNQAAEGQQQPQDGQNLQELIERGIEQRLGPIQQRENVRMTNEANALFERTIHGMAVEAFKAEGIDVANIPQDEMFMLTSAASEILKYDDNALKALKYEGKTAAIQKAFSEAKNYLDKYYLARSGRDKARLAPPSRGANGQFQPQQAGKKPTLDEMIENPGVISDKYR